MYARKASIVLIGALALTLGLTACDVEVTINDGGGLRGSGNVVTEQMDLTDFTAVEVANAFEVDITRSDSFSVTVRIDDNILDRLDVSKSGDTLRIRLKGGTSLTGDVTLEASLTMPELHGLELSGASSVSVSAFRSNGDLDVVLSGACRLDGDLEAGSIDMEVSGASRVALEGSAKELAMSGSGASSLNLADFVVDEADVTLNGASEATLNVRERISPVDVSGASRLRYLGDPSLGDVRSSGASTVESIDD